MEKLNYQLHDVVQMKKGHPCGANAWEIIRLGADIRLKCTNCERSILLARSEFDKKLKKILISNSNN
ncbi:MAG: DUF951 domain-containing protein [Culicoidibacterales bacterium]